MKEEVRKEIKGLKRDSHYVNEIIKFLDDFLWFMEIYLVFVG